MPVVLGFDPGGKDAFAWCVCEFTEQLPLHVIAHDVEDCAQDAVATVLENLHGVQEVIAAGIDSPLFWAPAGDRVADQVVRDAAALAGCPKPWGTIQSVNSLRGACLVQGILALRELRRHFPQLVVSEAHPKALLWLLGVANANVPVVAVGPQHLPALVFDHIPNEHERDAALGALTAWAAVVHPPGWVDLSLLQPDVFFPGGAVVYYMPVNVHP